MCLVPSQILFFFMCFAVFEFVFLFFVYPSMFLAVFLRKTMEGYQKTHISRPMAGLRVDVVSTGSVKMPKGFLNYSLKVPF